MRIFFTIGRHALPLLAAIPMALALIAASMSAANAQASGAAFSGFSQNNKDPIQIEADELEVIDGESKAVYSGNVKIRQGGSTITTSKLAVLYNRGGNGGQGDVKRLDFSGGLVATSRANTATADRGSYIVQSERIVLTGNVVVSQGENVATGCKLEASLRTNKAVLSSCGKNRKRKKGGRVKTVITPGAQRGN